MATTSETLARLTDRLDEAENVTIWIAKVKLCAVGHLSQRQNKRNANRGKAGRQRLGALDTDAHVNGLVPLEPRLMIRAVSGTLQMDAAIVPANARVEPS